MATIDTDVQSSGVRRVLWITLVLNIAVSAGKVIVGHLSGSLAMVADGYHSLVDGSNNVIGLIVAAFAFAPPDRAHPYGHRKFETAATLLIGFALLALAWEIFSGAFGRTAKPALPEIGLLNWVVMAATIGVNLFVSWYEAREGRRLKSAFLVADATHTRADLYVSLGVVASFVAALARPRLGRPAGGGGDRRDHRLAGAADPPLRLQRPHRPRGDPGREARAAGGGRAGRPARPRRAQPRPSGRRLRGPHRPPRRRDEPARRPTASPTASRPSCRRPTPRSWTSSSTSSPRATRESAP